MRRRDAKPLAALVAVALPLDLFAYGTVIGSPGRRVWGLSFTFGQFLVWVWSIHDRIEIAPKIGGEFLTWPAVLGLEGWSAGVYTGVQLGAVSAGIALLAALLAVGVWIARVRGRPLDHRWDTLTGAGLLLGAAGFLVSRAFLHTYWLYSPQPAVYHFSLPLGVLVLDVVGVLFVEDWWPVSD